ncbi:MAG TPA: YcxB family protein [Chthoniobacteraceae bacterium]|jgi:hypothetical protein
MKIEYETTLDDFTALARESLNFPQVAGAIRKQARSMALTTAFVAGGAAYLVTREWIAPTVIGGLLFLVIAALGGSALRHETVKNAREAVPADPTDPALGHHTLEVTPEAVTETSAHHTLSVRWEAVSRVIQTEDHLFIVLKTMAVIIVPLRSFPAKSARDAFTEHLFRFVPHESGVPQPQSR